MYGRCWHAAAAAAPAAATIPADTRSMHAQLALCGRCLVCMDEGLIMVAGKRVD